MVGGAGSQGRHRGASQADDTRAQGDRHLQPVDGLLGDLAGPADRPEQGHVRPGRAAGAEGDHPRLRDDHQGEREQVPPSSGSDVTGGDPPCPRWRSTGAAAGRHGRLRVHGRRALAGVAHREPRVRPAGCGHGWSLSAAATRRRSRPRPAGSAGTAHTTDWRELIARDDIDVVDICTPGDSHAEIAHRRAGRRQARAVREAAGQHRGRGPGDGRGRGHGPGARGTGDVRVQLPPGARGRADAPARRGRPARRDPARPRGVPAGLDRRPAVPAGVAAAAGQGRLRRAGRHRRAHRRPDPVRHRPADHRGQRADRDVRQGAPAAGRVERPGRRRRRQRRPAPDRSPSTTPRCSWPGSTAARSPRTRRPGSPPAARTALRVEINGSLGSLVVRPGAAQRAGVLRRHRARAPSRASAGSW